MICVLAILLCSARVAAGDPVFDMHVHLPEGEQSVAEYEQSNRAAGVTPAAYGAMWFGGPHQARAGNPSAIRAGNDRIIELARRNPRMLPIGTVHPYDGDESIAELDRIAGRGIRVLKLHPHTQRFDASDPRVETVVRRAGELNVTVLFDNAGIVANDSIALFNLALACPKTRFVFAHMGALEFRFWNILPMARTAEGLFGENIYFDISAIVTLVPNSPITDEFIWTLRNVGIDRILIGSDFPQFSLATTLKALDQLELTEDEKRRIRHENARKLFRIE